MSCSKILNILVFLRHFSPGYKSGGPVRTITNMITRLNKHFRFSVVTLDRDLLDKKSYPGIVAGQWNLIDGINVYYITPDLGMPFVLWKVLNNENYDILYLNSFFDRWFSILPIFLRYLRLIPSTKLLLAPRGELEPGALQIKKIKKSFYLFFAKSILLYKDIVWHASSDIEAKNIKKHNFWGSRVVIAPVMVAPDLLAEEEEEVSFNYIKKNKGSLKLIFLSRITPKKNLDFILKILSKIKDSVDLDIYGPIDDKSYWEFCSGLVKRLPINITVVYRGVLPHNQVNSVFKRYHSFFFPTKSENFGHVIVEAMRAHCPVLISDQTPFLDLAVKKAGWVYFLNDEDSFINRIKWLINIEDTELREWRNGAYNYAKSLLRDDNTLSKNIELFLKVHTSSL